MRQRDREISRQTATETREEETARGGGQTGRLKRETRSLKKKELGRRA